VPKATKSSKPRQQPKVSKLPTTKTVAAKPKDISPGLKTKDCFLKTTEFLFTPQQRTLHDVYPSYFDLEDKKNIRCDKNIPYFKLREDVICAMPKNHKYMDSSINLEKPINIKEHFNLIVSAIISSINKDTEEFFRVKSSSYGKDTLDTLFDNLGKFIEQDLQTPACVKAFLDKADSLFKIVNLANTTLLAHKNHTTTLAEYTEENSEKLKQKIIDMNLSPQLKEAEFNKCDVIIQKKKEIQSIFQTLTSEALEEMPLKEMEKQFSSLAEEMHSIEEVLINTETLEVRDKLLTQQKIINQRCRLLKDNKSTVKMDDFFQFIKEHPLHKLEEFSLPQKKFYIGKAREIINNFQSILSFVDNAILAQDGKDEQKKQNAIQAHRAIFENQSPDFIAELVPKIANLLEEVVKYRELLFKANQPRKQELLQLS